MAMPAARPATSSRAPAAPSSTTTAASPRQRRRPPPLSTCRSIGNRAIEVAQDGGGGAVYLTGHREFVCVRCRFENNQGANGGGLVQPRHADRSACTTANSSATLPPAMAATPAAAAMAARWRWMATPASFSRSAARLLTGNYANAFGAGLFTTVYDQTSVTRIWQSTLHRQSSRMATDQHTGGAYIQGGPVSIRDSNLQRQPGGRL